MTPQQQTTVTPGIPAAIIASEALETARHMSEGHLGLGDVRRVLQTGRTLLLSLSAGREIQAVVATGYNPVDGTYTVVTSGGLPHTMTAAELETGFMCAGNRATFVG